MIKILQYGEGNFLRTFADAYFDTLNKEGGEYSVSIVKPITFGSLENFKKQGNKYSIVLRGVENGSAVEKVYKIDAVKDVICPFEESEKYYALADDEELKIIISNTTEAGICFNADDKFDGFDGITYPAKLTKFLYRRYEKGLSGVYILPVELIENNADELYRCVNKYIELWGLSPEFGAWNENENFYCNTLVDRIVSGYPRDEKTLLHLNELAGGNDALLSVGEPFGLWAIEQKGEIDKFIKEGRHNIEVVLTNDINYYKKRKVRVLNGSHTNLVAAGIMLGKETVYDCMKDGALYSFFKNTAEEIIPFVSPDEKMTRRFAEEVEERFLNPFLNHLLLSIALNSISKWRARNLPTFKDYYKKHGKIPANMTLGFSYLMALYMTKNEILKDNAEYLEYFREGKPLFDFMKNEDVWGEDLTGYEGFYEAVKDNTDRIRAGEVLL